MNIAYIFNENLDPDDQDMINRILKIAGYNPENEFPVDLSSVDAETTIGVVGLPIETTDADIIDLKTKKFSSVGIRIVGIWLRSESIGKTTIPECLEKYGSATVSSESPDIHDVLRGSNDTWEEPSGTPRPNKPIKRNRC